MTHPSRRRRVARALITLLPAALLSLGLAAPAYAAGPTVSCGATLNQDAVLTADLTCAGAGVTLGPAVTLDLGGHQLSGNGSGTAVTFSIGGAATVKNGTIRNWTQGLFAPDSADLVQTPVALTGLTLTKAPLDLSTADITVSNSTLTQSPLDLWVTATTATNTTFDRSDARGEMNTLTLTSSKVVGGGLAQDENNTVTVVDSVLDGTGYNRPAFLCSGAITLTRSTVRDYAYPITASASSCPLTVAQSSFRNNPQGAIFSEEGGTEIAARITGSSFRSNGKAVTGSHVVVEDSSFTRNTTGVILSSAAGSSISGSTFRSNRRHGIYVATPGLALADNTAVGNRGYGIHAPGAVDLGGNRARGNRLGNCVGVTC